MPAPDPASIRVGTAKLFATSPEAAKNLTRSANTCVKCGLAFYVSAVDEWVVTMATPADCEHELAAPDTDDDQEGDTDATTD